MTGCLFFEGEFIVFINGIHEEEIPSYFEWNDITEQELRGFY